MESSFFLGGDTGASLRSFVHLQKKTSFSFNFTLFAKPFVRLRLLRRV